MKRGLIVGLGVLTVAGGAWYGLRHVSAPTPVPVHTSTASRTPGERVQPDRSWADLFDTLDQQWNDAGKTHVQAISPVAGTPVVKNNNK